MIVVCKFETTKNNFFIVFITFCIYVDASLYGNIFSFTLFSCLK